MDERKPLIAGNWKMNLNLGEAVGLVNAIRDGIQQMERVDVLVAPPFTALAAVKQAIGTSRILLGAQNMHWERSGAYTGEISGLFLKALGCEYVVIGHSERRHIMGETDEVINKKLKTALEIGLIPILCMGEKEEEREAGRPIQQNSHRWCSSWHPESGYQTFR